MLRNILKKSEPRPKGSNSAATSTTSLDASTANSPKLPRFASGTTTTSNNSRTSLAPADEVKTANSSTNALGNKTSPYSSAQTFSPATTQQQVPQTSRHNSGIGMKKEPSADSLKDGYPVPHFNMLTTRSTSSEKRSREDRSAEVVVPSPVPSTPTPPRSPVDKDCISAKCMTKPLPNDPNPERTNLGNNDTTPLGLQTSKRETSMDGLSDVNGMSRIAMPLSYQATTPPLEQQQQQQQNRKQQQQQHENHEVEQLTIGKNGQASIVSHLGSPRLSQPRASTASNVEPSSGNSNRAKYLSPELSIPRLDRSPLISYSPELKSANPKSTIPPVAPFASILQELLENPTLHSLDGLNPAFKLTVASVMNGSIPLLQEIAYYSLLETDPRVIILSGTIMNQDVASIVRAGQNKGIHSIMGQREIPITSSRGHFSIVKRQTRMLGKMYSVVSPRYAYRFGTAPKVINIPTTDENGDSYGSSEVYWEELRQKAWRRLSNEERALYAQTSKPGSPELDNVSILPYMEASDLLNENNKDLADIYSRANDAFALLVFKITDFDVKDIMVVEDAILIPGGARLDRSDFGYTYGWRDVLLPTERIVSPSVDGGEWYKKHVPKHLQRVRYTMDPPHELLESGVMPVMGSWYQL